MLHAKQRVELGLWKQLVGVVSKLEHKFKNGIDVEEVWDQESRSGYMGQATLNPWTLRVQFDGRSLTYQEMERKLRQWIAEWKEIVDNELNQEPIASST
jgi:hypothetical protein